LRPTLILHIKSTKSTSLEFNKNETNEIYGLSPINAPHFLPAKHTSAAFSIIRSYFFSYLHFSIFRHSSNCQLSMAKGGKGTLPSASKGRNDKIFDV